MGTRSPPFRRDPARIEGSQPHLATAKGDVLDPESVAAAVAGHDAVISAVGPRPGDDPGIVAEAARPLLDGVRRAGVRRLLVVGGAGSLEVAPGVQLIDSPTFPAEWKPVAQAHRDELAIYRRNTDLDWSYLSPAGLIGPGTRTGKYRVGADQLLTDAEGKSTISMEDFAVALLDELEHPAHIRQRFTVAY